MPKYYPPKKPSKKEIDFALDVYKTKPKINTEIEAMPPDPVPKQRKKRVSKELPMQRHLVQEFIKHYPGYDIISLRDERTNYKKSEKQLQGGIKRPDVLIVARRHGSGGLYLELKSEVSKYLTKANKIKGDQHTQRQYRGLLKRRQNGYLAFFAGGFDEAWSIVKWYMDGDGCHPLEYLYSDVLDMVNVVEIRPNIKSEVRNGKIIIDPESFDEWLKN